MRISHISLTDGYRQETVGIPFCITPTPWKNALSFYASYRVSFFRRSGTASRHLFPVATSNRWIPYSSFLYWYHSNIDRRHRLASSRTGRKRAYSREEKAFFISHDRCWPRTCCRRGGPSPVLHYRWIIM